MTKPLSDYRKRILYRAMHRGIKEADLIIGRFAQAELADMTDEAVAEFEALLEVPDQQLYAWIIGRQPTPPEYETDMMARVRAFDVAATIKR